MKGQSSRQRRSGKRSLKSLHNAPAFLLFHSFQLSHPLLCLSVVVDRLVLPWVVAAAMAAAMAAALAAAMAVALAADMAAAMVAAMVAKMEDHRLSHRVPITTPCQTTIATQCQTSQTTTTTTKTTMIEEEAIGLVATPEEDQIITTDRCTRADEMGRLSQLKHAV